MKYSVCLIFSLLCASAVAHYSNDRRGEEVTCIGNDNVLVVISADRSRLKFTVDGVGDWADVISIRDNGVSRSDYSTDFGRLTFSTRFDDYYLPAGEFDDERFRMPLSCFRP